jgi:hypothetical protein
VTARILPTGVGYHSPISLQEVKQLGASRFGQWVNKEKYQALSKALAE